MVYSFPCFLYCRSSSSELVKAFPEPEMEFHKRLRDTKAKPTVFQPHTLFVEMVDQPMWTTRQAAPVTSVPPIRTPDTGDNFEIKGQFFSMIRELSFD